MVEVEAGRWLNRARARSPAQRRWFSRIAGGNQIPGYCSCPAWLEIGHSLRYAATWLWSSGSDIMNRRTGRARGCQYIPMGLKWDQLAQNYYWVYAITQLVVCRLSGEWRTSDRVSWLDVKCKCSFEFEEMTEIWTKDELESEVEFLLEN